MVTRIKDERRIFYHQEGTKNKIESSFEFLNDDQGIMNEEKTRRKRNCTQQEIKQESRREIKKKSTTIK